MIDARTELRCGYRWDGDRSAARCGGPHPCCEHPDAEGYNPLALEHHTDGAGIDGLYCWCIPRVERLSENNFLIIHNAKGEN